MSGSRCARVLGSYANIRSDDKNEKPRSGKRSFPNSNQGGRGDDRGDRGQPPRIYDAPQPERFTNDSIILNRNIVGTQILRNIAT
jgi:hypothetical protein